MTDKRSCSSRRFLFCGDPRKRVKNLLMVSMSFMVLVHSYVCGDGCLDGGVSLYLKFGSAWPFAFFDKGVNRFGAHDVSDGICQLTDGIFVRVAVALDNL